jgi:hypothetical protein
VHIPGTAFGNGRTGPARGLRRLATRVSENRGRQRQRTVGPDDTGHHGTAVTAPRQPPSRPDPVLRWKDPTQSPRGDFIACAVPNAQLKVHAIPAHGDSWDAVSTFSLSYDGYAYWDDVTELASRSMRGWTRARTLPATVDEVRACLFYEQRRWHHFGEDPNGRGAQYIWALLDALRNLAAVHTVQTAGAVGAGRRTDDPVRLSPPGAPGPVTGTRAGVRSFLDDDQGYLAWATEHSDGYVVNADRTLSPNSLTLHRASCSCIGGPAANGRTRTANYRKVCGADVDVLVDWCRNDIGTDPARCRHCRPLQ